MPVQWTTAVPGTSNTVTLECDCYVHQFGAIAPRRRESYYETDMSDAEWALVRASMPMPAWMESRGGRPEAHCHRDMVDAARYVVDNGAKWSAVPRDFPWWRAVYDFFRRWRAHGYVRELYQRLRRANRVARGRGAEPTAGIIDAQSVDGADTVVMSRGFDGNKKRDGRKRSILTDTCGDLLEVIVTPADVHDSKPTPALLDRYMDEPGRLLKLVWADSAYQGQPLADAFARHGVRVEVVQRPDGTRGFTVLARRWAVERTLGQLSRARRLNRDHERRPDHHEQMVRWAGLITLTRRITGERRHWPDRRPDRGPGPQPA